MNGCVKKSSTYTDNQNSVKTSVKSKEKVTVSDLGHDKICDINTQNKSTVAFKQCDSVIQRPLKSSSKPILAMKPFVGIMNSNLEIKKPISTTTYANRNLKVYTELIKPKYKAKVYEKSEEIKSTKLSQCSVELARRRYAHLSQCKLPSKGPEKPKKRPTSNENNSEPLEIFTKTNKQSSNPIKKSNPKTVPSKPRPAFLLSTSTSVLNSTPASDLCKDLNSHELFTIRGARLSDMVKHICQKCKFISFNEPRNNMPLLVLDLDATVCDFVGCSSRDIRSMRPYLNYFLEDVYLYFDIAIWSATNMNTILQKLDRLNLTSNSHSRYKISFCLDVSFTIKTNIPGIGWNRTKPVLMIWELFDNYYNQTNTLIVDDQWTTFHHNPEIGVRVSQYNRRQFWNDIELISLSKYLRQIASLETDFSKFNHELWRTFIEKF